jgi:hypothetical protein
MPIPGRNTPTTAWVGGELILVGGDTFTCPDGADCMWPEGTIRSDGASLDPAAGTWRRIADAPDPISGGSTAVVGDDLYLLASHGGADGGRSFLRYRTTDDTWTELALPGAEAEGCSLVAVEDRIVAWHGTDETEGRPDRVFDPATEEWSDLPTMPIAGLFDRRAVWAPPYLYVFGAELSAVRADEATLTQVARLDWATQTWEELADHPATGYGPFLVDDGVMVEPDRGEGYSDEPEGPYPHGGIIDIATGEWSALPPAPAVDEEEDVTAGAFGSTTGFYSSAGGGLLLDVAERRWVEMPALDAPAGDVRRRATAAGRDAVVVAGLRWADRSHDEAELLTETWIWRPPAPG